MACINFQVDISRKEAHKCADKWISINEWRCEMPNGESFVRPSTFPGWANRMECLYCQESFKWYLWPLFLISWNFEWIHFTTNYRIIYGSFIMKRWNYSCYTLPQVIKLGIWFVFITTIDDKLVFCLVNTKQKNYFTMSLQIPNSNS